MQEMPTNPYAASRYIKFKEGTIRLRLFNHVDGWEYWVDAQGEVVPKNKRAGDGGKPVRVPQDELDKLDMEAKKNARYFRAYRVYNYETGRTEIMQLTQRTIIEPLIAYYYDEDWGNGKTLSTFDIAIKRTGEGLDTTYQVTPKPKAVFKEKVEELNLDALYTGDDPFATATVAESNDDVEVEDIPEDLGWEGSDELDGEL